MVVKRYSAIHAHNCMWSDNITRVTLNDPKRKEKTIVCVSLHDRDTLSHFSSIHIQLASWTYTHNHPLLFSLLHYLPPIYIYIPVSPHIHAFIHLVYRSSSSLSSSPKSSTTSTPTSSPHRCCLSLLSSLSSLPLSPSLSLIVSEGEGGKIHIRPIK